MEEIDHAGRRLAGLIGFAFGCLLHVLVGVFVFSSGLVAPSWAVAVLVVLWFVAAALLWIWRRDAVRSLLVPVAMGAIWYLGISAGGAWLGWTA